MKKRILVRLIVIAALLGAGAWTVRLRLLVDVQHANFPVVIEGRAAVYRGELSADSAEPEALPLAWITPWSRIKLLETKLGTRCVLCKIRTDEGVVGWVRGAMTTSIIPVGGT